MVYNEDMYAYNFEPFKCIIAEYFGKILSKITNINKALLKRYFYLFCCLFKLKLAMDVC